MPFTAYIEEAGDEGIERGSRWFIVAAVIVEKSKDLEISRCIDEIKQTFKLQPLAGPIHWRNIKHLSIRKGIIDCVTKQDLTIVYILCDTYDQQIINSTLKGKGRLYFYLARRLLERISWFGSDLKDTVDLVFANRSNMSYPELKEYLEGVCQEPGCQIKSSVINLANAKCYNADQFKLLQVADICVSACFNALEVDQYGYCEERYLLKLWDKIYRRNGNLFSYGFKFLPSDLHLSQEIIQKYSWIR